MFTKTLIATALVLGTVSASFATEFDSNLQNRYPNIGAAQSQVLQSAPVSLQSRNVSGGTQILINNDRELPRAGGVG
jgi:hypothetical protein